MRTPIRSLTAVACILALTACGENEPAATTTTSADPTTTTSSTIAATTTTPPAADLDVQAEIDWIVSILNGEELTEEEYNTRFTDEFRTQVPFTDGFQAVLDQFRPQAPFTVAERVGEGARGEAVIEGTGGTPYRVLAELDGQNRFAALLFQPNEAPTLDDPPETVAEAFSRLGEIGTFRGQAAEVVDGQCVAIEEVLPTEPAPLGSVFKLYVLAALGEAVESGNISWDDDIVIRDALKSIPSGELQDRADGETVSVLEAAELMISISDNTATDHLIDLVGRENVESVMADYGHTTPQLNIPLLNTRELTALKIGPAEGLRIQWLDGDEAARRAILEQISDITPADLPVQEWVDPVDPDLLEWFASPDDQCTLAVRLSELADSVPEVGEILSINPGVPGAWEGIWFKGGSEPGLAAAWWVTESEGQTFVTAGSVVDPEANIDVDQAVLLMAAARDLLANP